MEVGLALQRLDESSIDEAHTHGTGHFFGHRKGGRGGGGHDPRWFLGIRHAVGLGKFQRAEVGDGFLGGEGVFNASEADAMRRERQTDHEGREEIGEILCHESVRVAHRIHVQSTL